jgi:hypothetical protein
MRDHRKRVRASGRDPRVVAGEAAEEVVREVIAEEVRPAIRDVLTEDVLEGIAGIVAALPLAIATAIVNLESDDEQIRQRAAELIMRYSAGNKNIVPDVNAGKTGDLNVHFDLPRPMSREELGQGPDEGEVVEEKVCDSCSTAKPLAEFVGTSDRCFECFERMKNSVVGLAEKSDPPA